MSPRLALLCAALTLPLAAPALAGDCTVYEGARVHLPEGPRDGFSVVVLDGRVADVGSNLGLAPAPGGLLFRDRTCTLVKLAATDVITPGLVTVGGQLGLVEVGMEGATRTHDAGGDEVRAAHVVANSYDPRSSVIAVQRIQGITSAVVEPTGGMIAGSSAWVDLLGATQAETVIATSVAMPGAVVTPSPSEGLRRLSELFDDARRYAANRRAFEENRSRPLVASRLDLEALQPLLAGDVPLVLGADRASEIEALIRWSEDEGIRLVIRGAAEGWRHAAALAEADIAVIINPYVYGPGSFDQREGRADNARLLSEAGVDVIISTSSAHFARGLRQMAGNAVRGGMDHTDAVRSITSTPAEVFGITDRGEISRGAYANLVIWSGDPLEISTRVKTMLIGGAEVDLTSRQTNLFDRYRELPGSPVPDLPLPGPSAVPAGG
ncbi:MAG: amidohydrolase family protein [Proteobacteria bacterium]|nr:amidohydrolase family protein [Pseudomonadota bacterium]